MFDLERTDFMNYSEIKEAGTLGNYYLGKYNRTLSELISTLSDRRKEIWDIDRRELIGIFAYNLVHLIAFETSPAEYRKLFCTVHKRAKQNRVWRMKRVYELGNYPNTTLLGRYEEDEMDFEKDAVNDIYVYMSGEDMNIVIYGSSSASKRIFDLFGINDFEVCSEEEFIEAWNASLNNIPQNKPLSMHIPIIEWETKKNIMNGITVKEVLDALPPLEEIVDNVCWPYDSTVSTKKGRLRRFERAIEELKEEYVNTHKTQI